MDIKVGIQHVTREVVWTAPIRGQRCGEGVYRGPVRRRISLRLNDAHGRKVLILADKIAYIDIGEENARRVGFGTLLVFAADCSRKVDARGLRSAVASLTSRDAKHSAGQTPTSTGSASSILDRFSLAAPDTRPTLTTG